VPTRFDFDPDFDYHNNVYQLIPFKGLLKAWPSGPGYLLFKERYNVLQVEPKKDHPLKGLSGQNTPHR
jgi:hypothetical protein